jgi:hypothetical protein
LLGFISSPSKGTGVVPSGRRAVGSVGDFQSVS